MTGCSQFSRVSAIADHLLVINCVSLSGVQTPLCLKSSWKALAINLPFYRSSFCEFSMGYIFINKQISVKYFSTSTFDLLILVMLCHVMWV